MCKWSNMSSSRGLNASLELASMEMEAKDRAKKHVANLLQVGFIVSWYLTFSLFFICRGKTHIVEKNCELTYLWKWKMEKQSFFTFSLCKQTEPHIRQRNK